MKTAALVPGEYSQPAGPLGTARVRSGGSGATLLAFYHGLLAMWDSLVVGACGVGCAWAYTRLWFGLQHSDDFLLDALRLSVLGTMISLLVSHHRRATFNAAVGASFGLVKRSMNRLVTVFGLLLVVAFLSRFLVTVPRLWVMMWIATTFVVSVCGRLLFTWHLDTLLDRGLLCERVAVVGRGEVADSLLQHIRQARERRVIVAGVFGDILSSSEGEANRSLQTLIDQARRGEIERVILTLPVVSEARLFEVVYKLKAVDVEVAYCPSTIGVNKGSTRLSEVAGAPLVVLTNRPVGQWGAMVKTVEDRLIALLAILLLCPLMAVVAAAIRIDSPGPVIFRQNRHGWNGSEFQVFKFRTMRWADGPAGSGEQQTSRTDRRITRIGAFLRRSSLDELPQLFNVLNGTMSLVGPRPHPVVMRTEQRLGEEIVAEYSHRHRMKPGITGWAQIKGHRGATETAEQVRLRVEHDIYYIDNWSFLFDLRILLQTPFCLLFQRENAF